MLQDLHWQAQRLHPSCDIIYCVMLWWGYRFADLIILAPLDAAMVVIRSKPYLYVLQCNRSMGGYAEEVFAERYL